MLLFVFPVSAYEIDGTKWIGGGATFYVDIEGKSLSEISWNFAVMGALQEWSEKTIFEFSVVEERVDPCLNDYLNSINFADDYVGKNSGRILLQLLP